VIVHPLSTSLSPLSISVLDAAFSVYGKIENILMKKHRAFITYYHSQDADRAVALHAQTQHERRWKVERMPLPSNPNSDKQAGSALPPVFPSVPVIFPSASVSISDYERDTLARMMEAAAKKKQDKQAAAAVSSSVV